ncbi:hypothetical protein NQZ68_029402 [Dissostichus eleginoides]|nr:hypothetical protein NQZ68_029402 [Dissostichus eleginoides]
MTPCCVGRGADKYNNFLKAKQEVRAHPEHRELGYICILHLLLLVAAFSDDIHYETRTDENEEDYAYNLGINVKAMTAGMMKKADEKTPFHVGLQGHSNSNSTSFSSPMRMKPKATFDTRGLLLSSFFSLAKCHTSTLIGFEQRRVCRRL